MDQRASNKNLIELIKRGIDTKDNYEKLYNQNRGFIYQVIRRRVHGINEIDDLMQQAFLGLVKAVDYHNSEHEHESFLQILKYCIWNEIRSLTSDIPAHMQAKIIKYRMTYDNLYNDLGYKPKAYQIMLEMDISLKELEKIRTAMRAPVSLDEPIGEDGNTTRLDLYSNSRADESTDFDTSVEKLEIRKAINEALDRLSEQSKKVIEKRYYKNFTLLQCGHEMNVSVERVRQIETNAMRKLRRDHKLTKELIDYTSLNDYKSVGANQFNNTWTSSTELLVMEREKLREKEQREQRFNEMIQRVKTYEANAKKC